MAFGRLGRSHNLAIQNYQRFFLNDLGIKDTQSSVEVGDEGKLDTLVLLLAQLLLVKKF